MTNQRLVRTNESIYGEAMEDSSHPNMGKCQLPFRMRLAWKPEDTITRFSCHKLIVKDLESIFQETLRHYGSCEINRLGLDLFGGCHNHRQTRRGKSLSMHAYALAVDLNPLWNKLRWKAPQAVFSRSEYDAFFKIVYAHGFISLGKERDWDWMHIQKPTL